jgi:hypothetical protein
MATRVPYPAVCLGGIAIGLLISLSLSPGQLGPRRASGALPPVSAPLVPAAVNAPISVPAAVPAQPLALMVFNPGPPHIVAMLRDGRLMEAQDAYLEILVVTPDDEGAMRGLAAVRRRLALNDPSLLRRQAEAYGQAASQGVEISGEHYTRAAMALLAEASLRAAEEVEKSQSQKINDTTPP